MIIDTIMKRLQDFESAKIQANNDIIFLEERLKNISAKAESAAEAGKDDDYIALTNQASEIERRIYVKHKIIERTSLPDLTKEEVLNAWNEYAAAYGKKHAKKYEAYQKAVRELFEKYKDLVNDQNEALRARVKCGESLGLRNAYDLAEFTAAWLPAPEGAVRLDGTGCASAELPLFVLAGLISRNELEDYDMILGDHIPRDIN